MNPEVGLQLSDDENDVVLHALGLYIDQQRGFSAKVIGEGSTPDNTYADEFASPKS